MIPVPINFRLSPVEISDILKDAHCQLIFVEDIFIHLIEQVQHFGNTIVVTQKPSAYSSAFFFRFQISSNISRSIDIDLRFVFLIPNFIELIRQIDPWSIFSKNRLLTNEL